MSWVALAQSWVWFAAMAETVRLAAGCWTCDGHIYQHRMLRCLAIAAGGEVA